MLQCKPLAEGARPAAWVGQGILPWAVAAVGTRQLAGAAVCMDQGVLHTPLGEELEVGNRPASVVNTGVEVHRHL